MNSIKTGSLVAATFACLSFSAHAFPDGASTPKKEEIRQRLVDKVFGVTLANKTTWRLEFKSGGHYFVNTSSGFNGVGDWSTEDGKICTQLRGRDASPSCSDIRVFEELVYNKRSDGEIIKYVPR